MNTAVLDASGQTALVAGILREHQVQQGTILIGAKECAERLGYVGPTGLRRLRAETGARIVPGMRDGRNYKYHWPTVIDQVASRKSV